MKYYDALDSVRMAGAGMKSRVDAREDVEFQYRQGGVSREEYHNLMDSLGVPMRDRRGGAKAYGVNADGVPFYVRGTGWMYR